jgi:hypothetical protein
LTAWRLAVVVAVAIALVAPTTEGADMRRSQLRHREALADREIDSRLSGSERYVDMGVVLHTVARDDAGIELLPGKPRVRILRTRRFGGLYDSLTRTWAGPTRNPVVWACSEEQEQIVWHDESLPEGVWMQGSMGSGKSTSGAIWLARRVIMHATHPLAGAGVTAPTRMRMAELLKTIFGPKDASGSRRGGMWPASWYSWREGDQEAVMRTGLQIDFRSAHIASAAEGSGLQGYNWSFCLSDELQDYYELDGDIQMRGRAAWRGRYERFVTATPKDDSGYRNFKSLVDTSPDWHVARVVGPNSPFTSRAYWDKRLANMSEREAQRKVWGLDVGPERRLYHTWSRTLTDGSPGNLRPVPELAAQDVTAEVLSRWGRNHSVLVGHDPGQLYDVSVLLKAYRLPNMRRHVWWVVDEVTTESTTTEQHVVALLKVLRDKWHANELDWKGRPSSGGRTALVRADPYSPRASSSGSDQPTRNVYVPFRQAGITIMPAAYAMATETSGAAPKPATIRRDDRIEMVCRLLCDAFDERRLFVACDDRGQPAAPRTVESLERSERDDHLKAESQKGLGDLSHWTAALGYALWELERPRVHDHLPTWGTA